MIMVRGLPPTLQTNAGEILKII